MGQSFALDGDMLVRRVSVADSDWTTTLANVADGDLSPEAAWWQSILRGRRVDPVAVVSKLSIVDAFCGSGGLALGVAAAAEAVHRKPEFAAIVDTDQEAVSVHRTNLGARRALARSVTGLVDYHVQGAGERARFGCW